MSFITPAWIVGFVFAYVWYMGGKLEVQQRGGRNHGLPWALASLLTTVAVIRGLDGGVLLVILGQLAVFAGITAWRVTFEK